MNSDSVHDKPVPMENVSSHEVEAESINDESLEVTTSAGGTAHELQSIAEILTKVELDLACSSEKLVNLDILFIHVASRENDFKAFAFEEEPRAEGPAVRGLEFDLLCGIFDSEIKELESCLFVLQNEIGSAQATLSSFRKFNDGLMEMEERFQGCENSLKQCFELVSGMKAQSANLKRLFASSGDENYKDDKELASLGNGDLSDINAKVKMQAAEHERNILRMLEKSLAREMDLERQLTESRQNQEYLELKMEQLLFCMEVEAEDMWGRLFEAENRADILLETSKELLGQNQIKNSFERIKEFEVKVTEAEKRARTAEAECKLLRESNMELVKDMALLKSNIADASVKMDQLERLLKDSEIKRQHAEASAVASGEKQGMLDCIVKDMEWLIKDLKSKVFRAGNQTERAEEKCIKLSESNAELIAETNFLRGKIQHLKTSLLLADETKKEVANDIRTQSKFIAHLALQLAVERERLYGQIAREKKIGIVYSQQMKDPLATLSGSHHEEINEPVLADNSSKNGTPRKGSDGETITSYETGDMGGDSSINEFKAGDADSISNLDTQINIDARQLKFKYVLMAVVVFGIPTLAAHLFQQ